MLESLSQNRPFLDGNKRVAIAATLAFLRVNGYGTAIEEIEAYRLLINLYETNRFKFFELEPWFRPHAIPRRSSLR